MKYKMCFHSCLEGAGGERWRASLLRQSLENVSLNTHLENKFDQKVVAGGMLLFLAGGCCGGDDVTSSTGKLGEKNNDNK